MKLRKEHVHKLTAVRATALNRFQELKDAGLTNTEAASRVKVSRPTLWRWNQRREETGTPAPRFSPGAPPLMERLGITEAMLIKVRALVSAAGSAKRAWLVFARTADCPRPLAVYLRSLESKAHFPAPLRAAVQPQRQHSFAA